MNKTTSKPNLNRKPTHPGEILAEEFLKPLSITQKTLADHIGVDIKVINRLINGRTQLSAEMALKLSHSFDTSPEFWLSLQYSMDLFLAEKKLKTKPLPLIKK
jgi:addiction module HigA family antidote